MESRYLYTVMCKGMKVLQRRSLKFSPNVFKNYGAYSTSSEVETPQIKNMRKLLEKKFPLAKSIDIVDISGGCGDMYQVAVESVEFKGLTTVNQHRLITEALKKEIEAMHALKSCYQHFLSDSLKAEIVLEHQTTNFNTL